MRRLTSALGKERGAGDQDITEAQRALNFEFPADYLAFMKESNGGEGYIGPNSYLRLTPIESLPGKNEALRTEEFSPGLIVFGGDGAENLYAFNKTGTGSQYVELPRVGADPQAIRPMGNSFSEFLERLSTR